MTRRGLNISRATRAFRVRALAVLCAVACVLLSSGAAHASAPVCDPSAATVPAPTPALPSQTGELSIPRDCGGSGTPFAERGVPGRDQAPLLRLWDLPDRAVPAPFTLPPLRGSVLPRLSAVSAPPVAAHVRGVFRPPRA